MNGPAARALLLDMDGLLIDSEPLWFQVERAFAASRGSDGWTHERALACTGKGMRALLATMRDVLGIDVDEERDEARVIDAFMARVGELSMKPGCRELLEAARGRALVALVSASPLRLVRASLGRFALTPFFDALVTGEMVARTKPFPDVYLLACERLGVEPRDAVVLEDSLAGATAGHAAGARVIAVPEGAHEGRGFEQVADVIVADLFEARRWIELVKDER